MTTNTPTPTVLDPAPARWFLSNMARIHVESDRVSVIEAVGAPGDMPPLHVHHDEDEIFYVLEGELTLYVAGCDPIVVRPGATAVGPRGIQHVYGVTSDTNARWIATTTGPGFAAFVREMSSPAPQATLPVDPQIDPAHVAAVAAEHGIEILGPPG